MTLDVGRGAILAAAVVLASCGADLMTTRQAPSARAAPFDSGKMTLPVLVAGGAPVWSDEARRAGADGRVVARCTLTEEGRLVDCAIVTSPSRLLSRMALGALGTRRYTAATYEGKPIRVRYLFPFDFRLAGDVGGDR